LNTAEEPPGIGATGDVAIAGAFNSDAACVRSEGIPACVNDCGMINILYYEILKHYNIRKDRGRRCRLGIEPSLKVSRLSV
jgi:hypothetical protein